MGSNFKLLITTDVSNEIWNYAIKLCESIKLSINADILAVNFGKKLDNNKIEEIKSLDIKVISLEYQPEKLLYEEKDNAENFLLNVIKEFKPDIIHLNHYFNLKNKVNCPVVITAHNDLISLSKWSGLRLKTNLNEYRNIVKNAVNSSNIILSTSRFGAECLIKEYEIKNNIRIIYNSVNTKPCLDFPEKICLLAEGNSNSKSDNLEILNKIAHKIPGNIKIKVIGKNFYYRNSKRIEWLDNLSKEDLIKTFNDSSIFLALSNYDPHGFASIMSAYSNCAILANNVPTYKEMWGDCAYIFERNNINSFIRSLNNLIENRSLLINTAKRCQAKALSSYNMKRMGLEYINTYKNLHIQKKQTAPAN